MINQIQLLLFHVIVMNFMDDKPVLYTFQKMGLQKLT